MKKVIFVENYSPKFDYSNCVIVALNTCSHYALVKDNVNHKCISDFLEFRDFIQFESEYQKVLKKFFIACDKSYGDIKINNEESFSPFHIMPPITSLLFDSLFSSAIQITKILNILKPRIVILLTSYIHNISTINFSKKGYRDIQYFEYLYFELINYLSDIYNYKLEVKHIKNIDKYAIIANLKSIIQKNIVYNKIYKLKHVKRKPWKKSYGSDFSFKNLKGKKILFLNKGWGLDKLLSYVAAKNKEYYYLSNNILYTYSKSDLIKSRPIKINGYKEFKNINFSENIKILSEFFHNAIGNSLEKLIDARLTHLHNKIFPSYYNASKTADSILIDLEIDYIIGNQKNDLIMYALCYLGSIKNECTVFFFQHGYDIYSVDRTFWELPANYYFASDLEFSKYLKKEFDNQVFYKKPEKIIVNQLGYFD